MDARAGDASQVALEQSHEDFLVTLERLAQLALLFPFGHLEEDSKRKNAEGKEVVCIRGGSGMVRVDLCGREGGSGSCQEESEGRKRGVSEEESAGGDVGGDEGVEGVSCVKGVS